MKSWFSIWQDNLLNVMKKELANSSLPPGEEHSYFRGSKQLSHYQAVVDELYAEFDVDPFCVKAGYLHGLRKNHVKTLVSREYLETDVQNILQTIWQLDGLDASDKTAHEGLVKNVLPSLQDRRGVIIFLIENLLHLDQRRLLSDWTRDFMTNPTELSLEFGEIFHETIHFNRNNVADECALIARVAEYYGFWFLRNVFDNACFYHSDVKLFRRLQEGVIEVSSNQVTRNEVECIRSVIPTGIQGASEKDFTGMVAALEREGVLSEEQNHLAKKVLQKAATKEKTGPKISWEWHHLASIARRLNLTPGAQAIPSRKELTSHYHRYGSVVIICDNQEDCYNTLGTLHRRLSVVPGRFFDFIGVEKCEERCPAGYMALHTMVLDSRKRHGIRVKLVAGDVYNEQRYKKFPRHYHSHVPKKQVCSSGSGGGACKLPADVGCKKVYMADGERVIVRADDTAETLLKRMFTRNWDQLKGKVVVFRQNLEKEHAGKYCLIGRVNNDVSRRLRFEESDIIRIRDFRVGDNKYININTPKGQRIVIPRDGTILNFTYKLNEGLLPFLCAKDTVIRVNDKCVDSVFHVLNDGDIVKITFSKNCALPPADWEKKVPASTRRMIRVAFKKNYQDGFLQLGREWIIQNILGKNIAVLTEDSHVKPLLESVFILLRKQNLCTSHKKYPTQGKGDKKIEWWLRQIGKFVVFERGIYLVTKPPFGQEVMAKIERAIGRVVNDIYFIFDTDNCPEYDKNTTKIEFCGHCRPKFSDEMIGVIDTITNTMVLHKNDSVCEIINGFPVRLRLTPVRVNYFTVETTHVTGITAKVLSCFHREGIPVQEVIAQTRMFDSVVIRIAVWHLNKQEEARIKKSINDLHECKRICLPSDPPDQRLEADMPPRKGKPLPGFTENPYILGGPIEKAEYFYGMSDLLYQLKSEFYRLLDGSYGSNGRLILLRGATRTGKTSLAKIFLETIKNNYMVTCYIRFSGSEKSYKNCEQCIYKKLEDRLLSFLKAQKKTGLLETYSKEVQGSDSLENMFSFVKESFLKTTGYQLVLVVDEFPTMIDRAVEEGKTRELRELLFNMSQTVKMLSLFIAPVAGVTPEKIPFLEDELLKNSRVLDIQPFDVDDTRDLLHAIKKYGNHIVMVDDKLCRRIWEDTRGNPCQLAIIASELWQKRQSKINTQGIIKYNHTLYDNVFWNILDKELSAFRRTELSKFRLPDLAILLIYILVSGETPYSKKEISNWLSGFVRGSKYHFEDIVDLSQINWDALEENISVNDITDCISYLMDSGFIVKEKNTAKYMMSSRLMSEYYKSRFR